MWASSRNSSHPSNKALLLVSYLDLSKPTKTLSKKKNFLPGTHQEHDFVSSNADRELKMVMVVRQDLKMKSGKIASQCAHAATGMYAELMHKRVSLDNKNKLREAAENIGLPTFVVADAGRTRSKCISEPQHPDVTYYRVILSCLRFWKVEDVLAMGPGLLLLYFLLKLL
ncbi:mitogen-activated protein kinase kinase kinase 1-like [Hibiscus syriacus]|uniref:peptidyl-tRNA hydrolase n=1 Tax=Hibiscus syriacus TaxID=106335 RepID=A0A6A2YTA3_HIBSY|nr:mitogen-activated protein kinase kinase kinase 1-like [Hibiscus syriacus]